jgi:hypothetical protein
MTCHGNASIAADGSRLPPIRFAGGIAGDTGPLRTNQFLPTGTNVSLDFVWSLRRAQDFFPNRSSR